MTTRCARSISTDPNDSRSLIGTLTQEAGFAGLEREFYLADDERARGLRARYEAHVARMLRLAGDDSAGAAAGAAAVMRLETALARTSMSRAETREPGAFTNVMTLDAFRALTPHID